MPKRFLTNEQAAVLKQAHRAIRDKKLADRIKAVLSLNSGYEYSQVARILLLDEVSLRRYVQKYQQTGVDGLLEMHYAGGKSNLSLIQQRQLKAFLTENTKRTAKEIVGHILKAYGVKYSVIGATKLLHRLGFAYKKPKIIPGKADQAKQLEFLQKYQEIKSKLKTKDQVYFLDSTHPQHNTQAAYGWILKGKSNDKLIKTNTGRDRINLNGALNLKDRSAVVSAEKTINKLATVRLLRKLARVHPAGKIYLILDNASYHHAKLVSLWLKRHRRFKALFLPPYSPNLNLIERLWGFFHRQVLWNRYFETAKEFKKESLKFFKNLNLYEKDLSTLLTDNFQVVPNLNLQT